MRGLIVGLCLLVSILGVWAAEAAAVPRAFFGVVPQTQLIDEDFRHMGRAKVGTLRLGFNWAALQPTQNSDIRWHTIDEKIGHSAKYGIEVLPFVNNTPSWVRPDQDLPPIETQADRNAFKSFMRQAVQRYGPAGDYWTGQFLQDFPDANPMPIRTWQIWNEPSSPAHWEPRPDADDYGKLVGLAEVAIHDVDPKARVMMAGIFYSPSDPGPLAPRFLKDLLAVNGTKRAIDFVAIHPYASNIRGVQFQIKAIREALRARHALGKEIFITEIGWASGGGDGGLIKTPRGQARMLRKAFNLAIEKRRSWNLGGVDWYSLVDLPKGTNTCSFCARSGLFTFQRDPKPAWPVFKSFTLR